MTEINRKLFLSKGLVDPIGDLSFEEREQRREKTKCFLKKYINNLNNNLQKEDEFSLDEINEEIKKARDERKQKGRDFGER